eukprot:8850067-Alexandrium_andersonii.AAC.1
MTWPPETTAAARPARSVAPPCWRFPSVRDWCPRAPWPKQLGPAQRPRDANERRTRPAKNYRWRPRSPVKGRLRGRVTGGTGATRKTEHASDRRSNGTGTTPLRKSHPPARGRGPARVGAGPEGDRCGHRAQASRAALRAAPPAPPRHPLLGRRRGPPSISTT